MKWISSMVLLALLALVVYAKPPLVERVCTPNDSWKQDCNDCICSEDNKPMCTRRDCTPSTTARPRRCRRGETWMQDCNTCRCVGGRAVCTLMACLGTGSSSGSSLQPIPVGNDCTPGDTWREKCNSCSCTSSGLAVCTTMRCLGKRSIGAADEADDDRLQR